MPPYLNFPMLLILVGSLIAASGAFLATLKQNQEKLQAATQRAQFEGDLRTKNEEIAELNKIIAASVTGGNSFCYVIPFTDRERRTEFMVENVGEFPLYDVGLRVTDLDVMEANGLPSFASPSDHTFDLGNLPPHGGKRFDVSSLSFKEERKRFNLFFSARNGSITQVLRMRKLDDGAFTFATRVIRQLPGGAAEDLYTHIRSDYPREPDGSVDWK